MTFSYSGDPGSSDTDEIRFYIQDTSEPEMLISNEEITWVVSKYAQEFNSNLYSASVCAKFLSNKFAREVTYSADGVSMQASELQQKYSDMADNLYQQYTQERGRGGGPDVGGILWGEEFDYDIKPLVFGMGMNDNPEAGRQSYGGHPDPIDYELLGY